MSASPSTERQAVLAGRAGGAMFFFGFGGLWLGVGAQRAGAGVAAIAAIVVVTLALLGMTWRRYRGNAAALAQVRDTPQRRRARRVFNIVNAVQWTIIVILGNLLASNGLGAWVVPMAIVMIGLHFLPLAHVFRNPAHYLTGLVMAVFGAVYPFVAPGGPADPVGMLGAGAILWLSAAWALRPAPAAEGAAAAS